MTQRLVAETHDEKSDKSEKSALAGIEHRRLHSGGRTPTSMLHDDFAAGRETIIVDCSVQ